MAGCCGAGGSIDSSAALGMTMAALGMTMAALGMTRTGDGNLAHSAPLRTCFGWGVRRNGEGSDKSDRLDELDRSD